MIAAIANENGKTGSVMPGIFLNAQWRKEAKTLLSLSPLPTLPLQWHPFWNFVQLPGIDLVWNMAQDLCSRLNNVPLKWTSITIQK